MSEHTTGPWFATDPTNNGIWHVSTSLYGYGDIATCWGVDDNADANARLIAAAPDMLATLREAEEYLDDRADVDDGIPDHAMRLLVEVRAAIAKATLPPQDRGS